jgi:hypothetical protein
MFCTAVGEFFDSFLEDERLEAARLAGAADAIESAGVRFILDKYQPHGDQVKY